MVIYGQVLRGRTETWSRAKLARAWTGTGAIFRGPSTTMDMRFDRGESGCYNNIENSRLGSASGVYTTEQTTGECFSRSGGGRHNARTDRFSARVRNRASVFLSMLALF